MYSLPAWLSLTLALAQQLFLLPDGASHIAAIEQMLNANEHANQNEEITRILRDLSQEQLYNQANSDARRSARMLLQYINTEVTDQRFLPAVDELLSKVANASSFSPILLARLYDDRGVAHCKFDDYTQAITDLNHAIELDPHNANIYGNRGVAYRALKQYDQALSDFKVALELDDSLAWVYVGRGEVYRHRKEYQLAIADFDRAILLNPHDPDAYEGHARVSGIIGNYDQAFKDIEYALTLDIEASERASLYFQLGEIYRHLHEYERSIEEFTRAIDLDATSSWIYGSRGKAYASLGQYQQAIDDYDRAIAISPSYAWGYGQRGKVYRLQRQYELALTHFDIAIKLDPNNAWAYDERGLVYADRRQYQEAFADFDRAIAINPTGGKAYAHRGSVYLALGDRERARADYARSCDLAPTLLLAHWIYTWLEMCQQRADLSTAEHLERIAALYPSYYIARVCSGVALWLHGDTNAALAALTSASTARPTMWDAHFWQGVILASSAQQSAIPAIERALENDMPPVLLAPLQWLAQDQPDFYARHIHPFLLQYGFL